MSRFLYQSLFAICAAFAVSAAYAEPTLVVIDDPRVDTELLFDGLMKLPINMNFYINNSKNRNGNLNFNNAFDLKREVDRLQPIAEARMKQLLNATFIAWIGSAAPVIDSYDFKTKSFNLRFDTYSTNDSDYVNYRTHFKITPGNIQMGVEDQARAEVVEANRTRHMNSKEQSIDMLRIKSAVYIGPSKGQYLVADRVAFRVFDDKGNHLIGSVMPNVSPEERSLLLRVDRDGVLRPN